jgi:hypothetical protein
MLYSGS